MREIYLGIFLCSISVTMIIQNSKNLGLLKGNWAATKMFGLLLLWALGMRLALSHL